MKRLSLLGAIAAVALLVPATHSAMAAPPAKVDICHMNSSNSDASLDVERSGWQYYQYNGNYSSYSNDYTYTYSFGRVISVNSNALSDHEGHGDSASYSELGDGGEDHFENFNDNDYSGSNSWSHYHSFGHRHSWLGRWHYHYYRHYGYDQWDYDYTSGNIKNADCYVTTYTNN